MEAVNEASRPGSGKPKMQKQQSAARRASVEKELVKELNVSWAQAKELVDRSKRQLDIGLDEETDAETDTEVKVLAKKSHEKDPAKHVKLQRKSEEERKQAQKDKRKAEKEAEKAAKDPEKKNYCATCGVQTHKGRVELKNDNVYYGICIKCNPKEVPPSIAKGYKERQGGGKSSAASVSSQVSEESKKKDTTSKASARAVTKASSKRLSEKMIEDEQRKEAVKNGLCPECGVKTHNVSWFNREALKNADVHYGTCIKCNPVEVPAAVRMEWEKKERKAGSKKTLGSSSASVGSARSLPKQKSAKRGSAASDTEGSVSQRSVGSARSLPKQKSAKKGSTSDTEGSVSQRSGGSSRSLQKQKSARRGSAVSDTEGSVSQRSVGSSRGLEKRPSVTRRASVEKELVKDLDISWIQARNLVNRSKRELDIDLDAETDAETDTEIKAMAMRGHETDPEPEVKLQRKTEEERKQAQKEKRKSEKEAEKAAKDPEKKNYCATCGVQTHKGTNLSRVELKNNNVYYGVCIKCNPDDVPPSIATSWKEREATGGTTTDKEDNDKEDTDKEGTKTLATTPSRRFADKMIEEERRKDAEKKGLCPDCGVTTHKVSWFNRQALTNSVVHYGVCIKCHPDEVSPKALKAWEKENHDKKAKRAVPAKTSSKKKVKSPSTSDVESPRSTTVVAPIVVPVKSSTTSAIVVSDSDAEIEPRGVVDPTLGSESEMAGSVKRKPDTAFLVNTFDIPPDVAQWLESNLRQDDLSMVVLAGASGRSLSTYMKPRRRRRRSSSHRRESDYMAPEEMAALRKEMQDMRKDMHEIMNVMDSAAETDAESDYGPKRIYGN